MLRKLLSAICFSAGLAIVLTTFSGGALPQPAMAQSIPRPTPRPPLPPEENGSSGISAGSGMGHIAGTVIDLNNGAPRANIAVQVGSYTLMTDENGNYDRWLPAGTYTVTLMLDRSIGMAAQPELTLNLPVDDRVVQHLNFYGAQTAPAPADAPQTVPTPQPTTAPVVEPTAQPETKARAPEAPEAPAGDAMIPARLPRTGNDVPSFALWLSVGVALMVGGVFIGSRADSLRLPALALASFARRRHSAGLTPAADAAALLAALLTTEVRASQRGSGEDALLRALLAADTERRRHAQSLLAELLSRPVMSA